MPLYHYDTETKTSREVTDPDILFETYQHLDSVWLEAARQRVKQSFLPEVEYRKLLETVDMVVARMKQRQQEFDQRHSKQ